MASRRAPILLGQRRWLGTGVVDIAVLSPGLCQLSDLALSRESEPILQSGLEWNCPDSEDCFTWCLRTAAVQATISV